MPCGSPISVICIQLLCSHKSAETSAAFILICYRRQLHSVINLTSGKEGFEMEYHTAGVGDTMVVVILVHGLYCRALLRFYRDKADTADTQSIFG